MKIMYTSNVSTIVFRQFNSKYTHRNVRLRTFFNHSRQEETLGGYCKRISLWFKEQSIKVADACIKQFETITAQRIRRGIRIFHLYTRTWDEILLQKFKASCKQKVTRNAKQFMISAVGVTMYDWDHERISDKEFYRCSKEIDAIYKLRGTTVVCPRCHLRLSFDTIQPNIEYCECNNVKSADTVNQNSDNWEPFIERQDMLIWRKQEQSNGVYAYKIYGSYPEITAEDFLQIQIDIEYRKEWDSTVQSLEILDTDPKSMSTQNHSTDVIYWETKWPRLFANRDYVYQRRWIMEKETGIVIIINRETKHPNAPNKPDVYRVTSYWSYMVIKPYTNFHEPGIEFGLTYFDDSGADVPLAISSWIAMSGIPDFMDQMRQASRDYKKYKTMKEETPSKDKNIITEPDGSISTKLDSEDATIELVKLNTEEKIPEGSKREDTNIKPTPEDDKTVSNYSFFSKLFA